MEEILIDWSRKSSLTIGRVVSFHDLLSIKHEILLILDSKGTIWVVDSYWSFPVANSDKSNSAIPYGALALVSEVIFPSDPISRH